MGKHKTKIRDANGKITRINWDAISTPGTSTVTSACSCDPDSGTFLDVVCTKDVTINKKLFDCVKDQIYGVQCILDKCTDC